MYTLVLCLYNILCYFGHIIGVRKCIKSRISISILQEAAQRRMEFQLGSIASPIYKGDFPESVKERISYLPKITPQLVCRPCLNCGLLPGIRVRPLKDWGQHLHQCCWNTKG